MKRLFLLWCASCCGAIDATELVSANVIGTSSGNAVSNGPRVARDGRYIVFSSRATDLVAGIIDTNGVEDVFRRDVLTGNTVLISAVPGGAATGDGWSQYAVVSADGRWIAFTSQATNLTAGNDANSAGDVFLRDAQLGTTVRLSSNYANGDSGNGISQIPTISADGSVVVFASNATNLTPIADSNSTSDVFAYDRVAATLGLISINQAGNSTANAFSAGDVCLSGNGRYIAFASDATDLAAFGNGGGDVFRRDRVSNTTSLVSINSGGTASGNGESLLTPWQCISDDGRYIVFLSYAIDLSPLDTDAGLDIYLRDVDAPGTELISINNAGTGAGNGDANSSSISGSGRYVTFRSSETDLVPGGTTGFQIFRRDRQMLSTRLITRRLTGGASVSAVPVAMAVAPDGRRIAFTSAATDLVTTADGNGGRDVFVWEAGTDRITLVSLALSGVWTGNASSPDVSVGAEGSIAFASHADDLVSFDGNSAADVFVDRSRLFPDGFE